MRTHLLYLASGNSRRFGENKLLYEFNGKPLFQHGLDMLWNYVTKHPDCTLTVVSRYREIREFTERYLIEALNNCTAAPIEKEIDSSEKTFKTDKVDLWKKILAVDSPGSEKGISYTIRAGLEALIQKRDVAPEDFILFVVADQPFFKTESLEKILSYAQPGTETASMIYDGKPGNPGLFAAHLIPELMNLTGDQGGRKIMKKHKCIYVEASSEDELADLDTKEDLNERENL